MQQRITPAEFSGWLAYRQKRGPLNPLLRQDAGFALVATAVIRAAGGKAEQSDFMPWLADAPEPADDLSAVVHFLTGATRGK